jgi:hypothetical protein
MIAAARSANSQFGAFARPLRLAPTTSSASGALAAQNQRKSGADYLAARTLCTTRISRAFYYNKQDFEPTSTDEIVKYWKKYQGGDKHPLWWKVWVGGAAALFLYEHLYGYTRPVRIMFPPGYGKSIDKAATEAEDEEDAEADEESGEGEEAADEAAADDAPADEEAPAPADEDPPPDADAPAEDPLADADAPEDPKDPKDPQAED